MIHTPSLSRRGFLAAAGCVLAAPRALAGAPARPVVIELFTSQGCSSCPKADALFAELCADPGVLALSYHVDYWDYLGWKDTLGSPEYSQRQYDYARARGDMNVYTPQLIVDGGNAFVGSNRTEVDRAIAAAAAAPRHVPITLTDSGDEFTIASEAAAGIADEGMFWLLPIIPRVLTKIMKGENTVQTGARSPWSAICRAARRAPFFSAVRPLPTPTTSAVAATSTATRATTASPGRKAMSCRI